MNYFTQALCWEYYRCRFLQMVSNYNFLTQAQMPGILQQTKGLSRHKLNL